MSPGLASRARDRLPAARRTRRPARRTVQRRTVTGAALSAVRGARRLVGPAKKRRKTVKRRAKAKKAVKRRSAARQAPPGEAVGSAEEEVGGLKRGYFLS